MSVLVGISAFVSQVNDSLSRDRASLQGGPVLY
ncbi:MAG: hypothetical protein GFH27_549371n52 [Chloroflexi bacterium AL-W]|nr:hypothetical protein [Chloroflexi bacterium AL-N1]NOK70913.1 hypothetical protein [Chloroflexi bacterium AL-N10]NOK78582.1 hypothetical protein [Chloroflexi bacterium AL-N5]NOK85814.1 hypothetical protein [Chloroflexi bacterium AL-W]NOK92730.1 hypothetical protein [Chloroflexi bacterium AL-N15]